MKRIVQFIIILLLLFITVYAMDEATLIDEYTQIYGAKIAEGLEDADVDLSAVSFSVENLLSDLNRGNNIFSVSGILSGLLGLFFGELKTTVRLLMIVPIIAVMNIYINGMHQNFQTKGATGAAFTVSYMVMAGVGAAAFLQAVSGGRAVVENVSVFMRVLVPVVLTSLASGGAVISATTLEVVLMTIIEITHLAVEKIFIPMVMAGAALNVVNNISNSLNTEKLVGLLNSAVRWGMGILLTIFVGIVGIQGIATGSVDGLAVKVTRFATSNLVPMVGGILAETVETVMNCSVVIKNSVGVVGIVSVILVSVTPVLKIAACLVVFRLCAALIQPISDAKCVSCIGGLADSTASILAMCVAVVVLFIILLTIMLNIGNSAVMLGR